MYSPARKLLLTSSLLALATACGGDASSGDAVDTTGGGTTGGVAGEPIDGVTVDCASPDSDADGLPDCEEEVLGTAPRSDDTDGDGLTDFEEVVDRNFDPGSNNFRFNPRVADVPRLSFRLSSLPDVQIHATTREGTTTTIGVERSQESARTLTTSSTQESSYTVEQSITTESSISVLDAGFSVSGTLSESWSQSVSMTQEQARENRTALSRSQETSREEGTELTGGTLRVTFAIENQGYQSVTLESLLVAATRSDPSDPTRFTPVANLAFDSPAGFAPIEIPPNGETSDQLIFRAELELGVALSLLDDFRNLTLRPATWTAVDINDRSFNASLETIGTKCARVEIDFGPRHDRATEVYFVSAVTDFSSRAISVRAALTEILKLPFTEDASGLASVRDLDADAAASGRWVLVHTSSDGVETTSQLFDPADPSSAAADLDALELRPGWALQLTYIEDRDGDGLLARSEFLAGSSDEATDSDSDGLDDFFEARTGWDVPLILDATRRVYPNPALADMDIDGLSDADEFALRTHPREEDTDRDGLRDDLDPEPADVSALVTLLLNGDTRTEAGDAWTGENVQPTTDRDGRPGMALQLDGTSSIFTDALFPEQHARGASWSIWIRPDDLTPDVNQGVLEHDTNESWTALWVSPEGVGGTGSSYGNHFIGLVEGTGNVTSGWHHVVGVLADQVDSIPGADSFLIYYDGELLLETPPSPPSLTIDPGRWILGAGVSRTSDPPFVGGVDDLRVYDRGLSADEVRVLYERRD